MKSIIEYVNEDNQEQQIDESFAGFAVVATEIALLVFVIGLFAKSFKEIVKGENGILDVANKLLTDVKLNKICKKLAKDPEIQSFISSKDNVKKDAFTELVKSKLSEKDAQYLMDITKSKLEEYIKK